MKKVFCLLFALALCFSLSACGKSEAVKAVEEQISAIGAIDENSIGKIKEIDNLYSALSEKEQGQVENYSELTNAYAEYDKLIADKVAENIKALGTIGEDSAEQIESVSRAYEALTDSQKGFVENYGDLQAAKEQYETILVTKVEGLIQKIQYNGGEPSPETESAIRNAQAAYDNLEEALKPKVKNSNNIESASKAVSQYYIQTAQAAINTAIETDSNYQEAEALYNALSPEQKKEITNYSTFTENYTAYKNRPPIELVSYRLKKSLTGQPQIYIKANNTSDKIIKEFSMTVFAFDDDGVPVSIYFGDYSQRLRYSQAIKPGESTRSSTYWQLYGEYSDMKQVVVVLGDIEFFDGSTWENSQYSALCSKYDQQLLQEGDKNILSRG